MKYQQVNFGRFTKMVFKFLCAFLFLFMVMDLRSQTGIVVFKSHRDGNSEIYIMNDDGISQANLTQDLAQDQMPSISPDGTLIAFASDRNGKMEVYKMKTDGTNVTQLTFGATGNGPNLIYGIDWHPDGSNIIFATRMDDPNKFGRFIGYRQMVPDSSL